MTSGQYESPVFDAPIGAGECVCRVIDIYLRRPLQFLCIGALSTIPLAAWLHYIAATDEWVPE